MDFVSGALAWGRKLRVLTVVDLYTARRWRHVAGRRRVARVLERIIAERARPTEKRMGQHSQNEWKNSAGHAGWNIASRKKQGS